MHPRASMGKYSQPTRVQTQSVPDHARWKRWTRGAIIAMAQGIGLFEPVSAPTAPASRMGLRRGKHTCRMLLGSTARPHPRLAFESDTVRVLGEGTEPDARAMDTLSKGLAFAGRLVPGRLATSSGVPHRRVSYQEAPARANRPSRICVASRTTIEP